MPTPNKTNTIVWHFQPPAGQSWEIHKFSIIDAIQAARNQLPYHEAQADLTLRCGPVAFAVLRQLPQFIRGPGKGGPVAWLQLPVLGPIGRDGLAEDEVVTDSKELSGLSVSHGGQTRRLVIVGAPSEFVELTIQQGFRL